MKVSTRQVDFREEWLNLLKQQGLILASDTSTLPRASEVINDIKAIAIIPLWDDDDLLGFVGFSDCLYHRDWRPEEVLMLHNLSVIITSILSKHQLRTAVSLHGGTLHEVLDHMDVPIYVSDTETGEILLANSHIRNRCGRDITGCICWEVIHGRTSMCPDCKVALLRELKGEKELLRLTTLPDSSRDYLMHDSLIHWSDNRIAHLAYAIDGEGRKP